MNDPSEVHPNETGYPAGLLDLETPPTIWLRGDPGIRPCIAVVGTRRCTKYGIDLADAFGRVIAGSGWTTVSGLARGIDTAAHRGCLRVDGHAIAVLGSGIDICYPRENWSVNDNQMGQQGSGNYFAFSAAPGIVDNYNYLPGSPKYNPDVDYGLSLSDMPHKVVIAPIVQLPFGVGRPYLNDAGLLDYLVGGWSVSAVGLIQSGFPIPVNQAPNTTNLNGAGQRPNIVSGASIQKAGDITSRLEANPADNLYLDPAAFSLAPAFTLGNAPRILPGIRSPARNSIDVAMNKDFRVGPTARATLRLEVLNLLNTPWYSRMASPSVGNANFAQVTTQANYSRFSQITIRFTF